MCCDLVPSFLPALIATGAQSTEFAHFMDSDSVVVGYSYRLSYIVVLRIGVGALGVLGGGSHTLY